MISYKPFWKLLKDKNISTYKLIYTFGIGKGTIHRMKNDKNITTRTVDDICSILHCKVEDIMVYIEDEKK